MSDRDERGDDAFGERVGRVLRGAERFGDHFETELAEAIRDDRPTSRFALRKPPRAAWWTTPITLRMSPLVGLAMAASVAILATWSARRMQPDAALSAAQVARDTVNVVRFVFVGDAQSVSLVGDFNAWRDDATPLTAGANRTWVVSV